MKAGTRKQGIVWGGLLILFGIMALVETYTDLGPWVWVIVLAFAGLLVFLFYLTDRGDYGLLLPTYVLWAVAGLIALTESNILRDPWVAFYVLTAVALPFLIVFISDRNQWWALIPSFVLLAVGLMVVLLESGILSDLLVPAYIMLAIAIPFLVVFARDRKQWWALIPAYVLLAIGLMVTLLEYGILSDLLIPAFIMFAIAIPFLVVFARDRKLWWALIPGGILIVIGTAFLIAEAALEFILPLVFIIVGIGILLRLFTRKEQPVSEGAQEVSEIEELPEE